MQFTKLSPYHFLKKKVNLSILFLKQSEFNNIGRFVIFSEFSPDITDEIVSLI